jgi:hypothetical protein
MEHLIVPQLDVNCVICNKMGLCPLSEGCDTLPEPYIPGKMVRSWRLHPVATQITRPHTHGLSFCEFVKDNVYIPPTPVDLQEIRDRIVNATDLVDVTSFNKL